MTNKEKIKYLSQYRKLLLEHEHIVNTYKELADKLLFPSPKAQSLTHAPKTMGSGNPIEQEYFRLMELEETIGEKSMKLMKSVACIEDVIAALHDSLQRTVLRLRYVDGLVWERICVEINYSWRQTHRIHSLALSKIQIHIQKQGTL